MHHFLNEDFVKLINFILKSFYVAKPEEFCFQNLVVCETTKLHNLNHYDSHFTYQNIRIKTRKLLNQLDAFYSQQPYVYRSHAAHDQSSPFQL